MFEWACPLYAHTFESFIGRTLREELPKLWSAWRRCVTERGSFDFWKSQVVSRQFFTWCLWITYASSQLLLQHHAFPTVAILPLKIFVDANPLVTLLIVYFIANHSQMLVSGSRILLWQETSSCLEECGKLRDLGNNSSWRLLSAA